MPSRLRRSSSATDCSASGPRPASRPGRRLRARSGPPGACRGTAGFSLLEVIVALAILGIGLGVVFQALSQGLRLRGESADNVRLALVAEGLAGDLIEREAAPAEPEEGEASGCRWRLEAVGDAAEPRGVGSGPAAAERRGAALVEVRLTVTAPSGRSWVLTSLLPRPEDTAP